jgi:hypothetical protein
VIGSCTDLDLVARIATLVAEKERPVRLVRVALR